MLYGNSGVNRTFPSLTPWMPSSAWSSLHQQRMCGPKLCQWVCEFKANTDSSLETSSPGDVLTIPGRLSA